jgi:hypothetical protein
MENFRNPKIREEIKKRLEDEIEYKELPFHRKEECEGILYLISVFEKEEQYVSL